MPKPAVPRVHLVALLMALPALAATIGLLVVEGYRLVRPDSILFSRPAAASLADAIRSGGLETVHERLRSNGDPNAPVRFQDPALTGGRPIVSSPLMIAVAARNGGAVQVLLAFGARMDLPQNAQAICLARDLGDVEIAGAIARDGRPRTTPACPPRRQAGRAPLVAYTAPAAP